MSEFGDDDDGLSGAVVESVSGGEYYFSIENTDNAWHVLVECRDGEEVTGNSIDLEGQVLGVTGNYSLPACEKSVLVWTLSPNDRGLASLMMDLHKVGQLDSVNLVSEFEVDATTLIEGETLQALSGGVYYLSTTNLNGTWSVHWECQG